ncbi:hypothetical protein E2C01_097737 [Portunus trituberculatus]|uniref:Uncharacterized protein n=1 Tax=Portunus trituberculatus TaxID=210409 RepID=A0A5B7K5L6_PORTR|nr:hypothetical protein [Portunus trituberculatus]
MEEEEEEEEEEEVQSHQHVSPEPPTPSSRFLSWPRQRESQGAGGEMETGSSERKFSGRTEALDVCVDENFLERGGDER